MACRLSKEHDGEAKIGRDGALRRPPVDVMRELYQRRSQASVAYFVSAI
jgi:hypothetical protein